VVRVGEGDGGFELEVGGCELCVGGVSRKEGVGNGFIWSGVGGGKLTERMAYDSPLMLLSLTLMPAELMIIIRTIVKRQQAHEMPEVHWTALALRSARFFDEETMTVVVGLFSTLGPPWGEIQTGKLKYL
jgi:hypothetical protein